MTGLNGPIPFSKMTPKAWALTAVGSLLLAGITALVTHQIIQKEYRAELGRVKGDTSTVSISGTDATVKVKMRWARENQLDGYFLKEVAEVDYILRIEEISRTSMEPIDQISGYPGKDIYFEIHLIDDEGFTIDKIPVEAGAIVEDTSGTLEALRMEGSHKLSRDRYRRVKDFGIVGSE